MESTSKWRPGTAGVDDGTRLDMSQLLRLRSFSASGLARFAALKAAYSLRRMFLRAVHSDRVVTVPVQVEWDWMGRTLLASSQPGAPWWLPVNAKPHVVSEADRLLMGLVKILGFGEFEVTAKPEDASASGADYQWHCDFASKYIWPRDLPSGQIRVTPGRAADIKVPWEFSRGHQLVTLARATTLSSDARYADEISRQVDDWIDANPVGYGVNWMVPMEAAIRAINWIWALSIMRTAHRHGAWTARVTESLWQHGLFIDANLEHSTRASDHYLSNIVGLLYIGLAFSHTAQGRRWLAGAASRFERQFDLQVAPDGVFRGGSIMYHRLVTELFLHGLLVCGVAKIRWPASARARVHMMLDFLRAVRRPDGRLPLIGDHDDGVVLPVVGGNGDPHGVALLETMASEVLGFEPSRAASATLTNRATSCAFPHVGFYVLRRDSHGAVVDCFHERPDLPFGYRHNSRLGFELWAFGKTFLIDPGTFSYTRSVCQRNWFRATAAHNVVMWGEQNSMDAADLAWLGSENRVNIAHWGAADESTVLSAELVRRRSFGRDKPLWRRTIDFDPGHPRWRIADELLGNQIRRIDFLLHFAPCEVTIEAGAVPTALATIDDVSIRISVQWPGLSSVELRSGWWSPMYGARQRAPVLRVRGQLRAPARILTVIDAVAE